MVSPLTPTFAPSGVLGDFEIQKTQADLYRTPRLFAVGEQAPPPSRRRLSKNLTASDCCLAASRLSYLRIRAFLPDPRR